MKRVINVAALSAILIVPSACSASEYTYKDAFKDVIKDAVKTVKSVKTDVNDELTDVGLVGANAGYYGRKALKAAKKEANSAASWLENSSSSTSTAPKRPRTTTHAERMAAKNSRKVSFVPGANGPDGPSWWSYYSSKTWNDTECLVLEGIVASIALYAGYKIYKRATRKKDHDKKHDKDEELSKTN